MPAWFYVLAAAAVLFVAWFAFARRWVHALFYSWQRASHAYREIEAEFMPAPLQGSMVLMEEVSYWNGDWREQTRVELAPETLDLLAAPPDDPGPGDSSSASPGPDHCPCGKPMDHIEFCYDFGPEPSRLADTGDLLAAREAHPHPDWLLQVPLDPHWLEGQLGDLYAWVRAMVPQVTGWSV